MPTILEIFGLRFFFFASEHEPIHVHVQKGGGEAKINLVPSVELVSSNRMKKQDIKKALSVVENFRDEFIKEWESFHKK